MSGITPLIDTVLHQVLGKRVDSLAPRDLNAPVRPAASADASRPLHSDSRLDARSPRQPQINEPARGGQQPLRSPAARPGGGAAPPPSTQTHFTQSARSIADVLVRFPAPPSVLQLSAPLVPLGETLSAGQMAERLQGSIRDSGLFYESHLLRWHRGELPREQLLREPHNMRQALSQTPSQTLLQTLSRAPSLAQTQAQASENAQAAGRELAAGRDMAMGRDIALAASRDPVQESLQGIVRQQLEMLVTPVLRWEGDVWTGLFMALVLQLPVAGREGGGEEGDDAEREEQEGYRASMTLEVAEFGEVRVAVWLRGKRLEVALSASEPDVQATLTAGVPRLESRLERLALDAVRVRVLEAEADGGA